MPNRRLIIESQCDRNRYRLSVDPDTVILGVTYRHLNGRYGKPIPQKVEQARIEYFRAWKTDGEPETENEASWFLRAIYEHHQGRKALWFYFKPTQTLILCPPPPDSGSLVSVLVDEEPEEVVTLGVAVKEPEAKCWNEKENPVRENRMDAMGDTKNKVEIDIVDEVAKELARWQTN